MGYIFYFKGNSVSKLVKLYSLGKNINAVIKKEAHISKPNSKTAQVWLLVLKECVNFA